MLLTVYCVRRDLSEITFSLDVDPDFELENFRALCELESGIPAAESLIVYAERPLTDNQRSLSAYGLKDGDVVVLRQKDPPEARPAAQFPGLPRIDFSSIAVPGTSRQTVTPNPPAPAPDSTSFPQGLDNPALLREMLLTNPHELSLLKERNPPLAEALLSGDLEKFTKVLLEQQQERAKREQERIRLFSADPFDLEAQAKIEEDIRQQNIEENMTIAMEEAPESFGQVVMLYINCKVNGYPVKAFVDSGAQMTIMSQACAERCHIMRLVDRRWAGIAKGVGTQKIIGRVHLAQVQIEGDFLPCSFSILEEQPMDMLLGLDMLKRHQCSIDLEKNVLVIGTTGTRTSFLPEGELPECARLAYGPGREDMRPEEIADRELAEVLQKSAEEADKETTSVEGPSLVSPKDRLHHLVNPSRSASSPHALSLSTQTCDSSQPSTETESTEPLIDLPWADAVCDGDQSFQDSQPQPSTAEGTNTARLPAPVLSADDSAGPMLALKDELPFGSAPDVLEALRQSPHVAESSGSYLQSAELHTAHSGLPSASPYCQAEETMASVCDPVEVTLGADSETVPSAALDDESATCNVAAAQAGETEPLSSYEVTIDAVSEGVDVPNPPASPGHQPQDSCFSLATALKELHRLLVTSGQLSTRVVADAQPAPESGICDVDPEHGPCESQNDTATSALSVCAEPRGGATSASQELPNVTGSPPSQRERLESALSPGEVLPSCAHIVCDGGQPQRSSDPQGQADPSVSAVERLVHAGFPLADALLALEQAEGNVELALLALLARNIVVPT